MPTHVKTLNTKAGNTTNFTGLIEFVWYSERQKLMDEATEENESPSTTTFCHLLIEILDVILKKSYLHWILNSPTKPRDEEVIRSLISVDVCFCRRITRRRFKKTIWRYLKDFYVKTMKRYAIIRNNRHYLVENINPNNELLFSMVFLKCITPKESRLIQSKNFDRQKNDTILNVMRSFDEERLSCFTHKCLRQNNQKTVARIMENGGGAIKIDVKTSGKKYAASIETELLNKKIEELTNRTNPWPQRTEKFINQLREEGIEILNSHLDGQTVVVWIWCHSQAALQYMQRLYESIQLRYIFFEVIQPSTSKIINIDRNQFKKIIVMCPISINFTRRIEIGGNRLVRGVTKLQNQICLLCRSMPSDEPNVICLFEDRFPFSHQKEIETEVIKSPYDIGSSEMDNCLYVSDLEEKCVWKISRETSEDYRIIKCLTIGYEPRVFSVSSDGQLLISDYSSSTLWIYGSDAVLIRCIQLPSDIKNLRYAVKTSVGNFILSHTWMRKDSMDDGLGSESNARQGKMEKANDRYEEMMEQKEEEGNEWEEGNERDEEEVREVEQVNDGVENELEVENKNEDERKDTKEVEKKKKKRKGWWQYNRSSVIENLISVVSELTSDGQMVVRRFIPSNKSQELYDPRYLSLDSDDQVFVVDNDRVILLDSDLKWSRFLVLAEDEDEETKIPFPYRLCYDGENKQLIVVGLAFARNRNGVNVYTSSRM